VRIAWQSTRLSEAIKRRLVDYFVLGVPAYWLRFHALASAPTVERFYRVFRQVLAIAEESTTAFTGSIECAETMFGGYREGKHSWGAAGPRVGQINSLDINYLPIYAASAQPVSLA
jgi:transposase